VRLKWEDINNNLINKKNQTIRYLDENNSFYELNSIRSWLKISKCVNT